MTVALVHDFLTWCMNLCKLRLYARCMLMNWVDLLYPDAKVMIFLIYDRRISYFRSSYFTQNTNHF